MSCRAGVDQAVYMYIYINGGVWPGSPKRACRSLWRYTGLLTWKGGSWCVRSVLWRSLEGLCACIVCRMLVYYAIRLYGLVYAVYYVICLHSVSYACTVSHVLVDLYSMSYACTITIFLYSSYILVY